MDFTFAVMQMNGDITDRCRRSFHAMHGRESGDRMVQGFHLMLVEYVPEIPTEIVRFRVPLNETLGLELNWHQPDAVSALGTFFFDNQPAVTCLLFSGYDAIRDAAAVQAAEKLLADWRLGTTMQPGAGVGSLRERPLLVAIPWPGSTDDKRKRRLTIYAECLAVAFFQRAAARNK